MDRKNNKKARRGAAFAMVLVFMVMMVMLGSAVLIMAQHSATQSAGSAIADRHYYAAESAAQLSIQMLLNELDETFFFKIIENIPDIPNMTALESAFEFEVRQALQSIYETKVAAVVNGMRFNNQTVRLGTQLGIPNLVIGSGYEMVKEEEEDETYTAYLYLIEPTLSIDAISGGRTVMVQTNAVSDISVTVTENLSPLASGVFYEEKSGGVYGDGNDGQYQVYVDGLNELLASADADYETHRNPSNVLDDPAFPSSASAFNWDDAVNAQYINTWSPITLGKAGQITVYPNLEYMKGGSLQILGTVYCPNLKGAVVNGGNIYGTWHIPSLDNLYMGGGNMTIHAGAKINPMEVDAAGKVTNPNKPASGGCNFYGDSVLTVNCDTELNWCRFNISNIAINYGNHGKLTSNSVFISRGWLNTSGTASDDIDRVIPQFYMRGYINLSANLGTIAGIFMTPDDRPVCNNGNGVAEGTKFVGVFLGNYDRTNVSPPQPIIAEVEQFAPTELEIMMDGGWLVQYLDEEGGIGHGTIEADIRYAYSFSGLQLRETTGE